LISTYTPITRKCAGSPKTIVAKDFKREEEDGLLKENCSFWFIQWSNIYIFNSCHVNISQLNVVLI